MIGIENGAAVSSRISNVRRRSISQKSAVGFQDLKRPLKTDDQILERNLPQQNGTEILIADRKKWKRTTNSFEMSVFKKEKQAKKEVRYVTKLISCKSECFLP